jgi:hypothetical protein
MNAMHQHSIFTNSSDVPAYGAHSLNKIKCPCCDGDLLIDCKGKDQSTKRKGETLEHLLGKGLLKKRIFSSSKLEIETGCMRCCRSYIRTVTLRDEPVELEVRYKGAIFDVAIGEPVRVGFEIRKTHIAREDNRQGVEWYEFSADNVIVGGQLVDLRMPHSRCLKEDCYTMDELRKKLGQEDNTSIWHLFLIRKRCIRCETQCDTSFEYPYCSECNEGMKENSDCTVEESKDLYKESTVETSKTWDEGECTTYASSVSAQVSGCEDGGPTSHVCEKKNRSELNGNFPIMPSTITKYVMRCSYCHKFYRRPRWKSCNSCSSMQYCRAACKRKHWAEKHSHECQYCNEFTNSLDVYPIKLLDALTALICSVMKVRKVTIQVSIDSNKEIIHWVLDKCSWSKPTKISGKAVFYKISYKPQNYEGSIALTRTVLSPDRMSSKFLEIFDFEKILSYNLRISMSRDCEFLVFYDA